MTLQKAKAKYLSKQKVWVDYPMYGFKDDAAKTLPVREAYMLHVPLDKYVKMLVLGTEEDDKDYAVGEVKLGYIHEFKDFRYD